jgi:acetoin utilization deacetylase AcuC-like enzyme
VNFAGPFGSEWSCGLCRAIAMTLLYDDPVFLNHNTGSHPECAARLEGITARLKAEGLDQRCGRAHWEPVDRQTLGRVHHLGYVDSVERFASRGGGHIERDTVEDGQALCLVRPPGHHAVERSAMGFCLFNNVAIAARMATADLELDRVLIVDWDVHHGNGTQATFWEDEQVGVFSIHRRPFFPGTGDEDEVGTGKGLGATRNLPVRFGTPRATYRARFEHELASFADQMRPQLVLISAGFDTHIQDPVGSLGLEDEDFVALTDMVLDVADQHAHGRVVSVLEGGYNIRVLPGSVAVHLETMLARQGRRPP